MQYLSKKPLTPPTRPKRRITSVWTKLVLLALIAAVLSLTPGVALAHGYIVRAIPEDRAVLERSPTRVQYWFSEDLEPEFSTLTIRDGAGNIVATGGVPENDLSLLAARVPSNLPDGAYVVEMRLAFASDGHVIFESRVFFVGAASDVAGGGGEKTAVPSEVVWRAGLLISTMLLFGVFTLYGTVLIPAWGNPKHKAGLLPPRVMNRLNAIVAAGLIGAFAANILALIQQATVLFGASVDRVLSEGLWNVVRIGTRFGDTWNVRMLLLIVIALLFAASIRFRRDNPEVVRPLWSANTWAMALVIGMWSISAHAAGALTLPWIALFSDWIHGAASGFWAGGLAALVLVLPAALAPYEGDARRQVLFAALRRFSRIATAALFVVVATGIYNALNWINAPSEIASGYGMALGVKLLFVLLLVGVGFAHNAALNPKRYERWVRLNGRMRSFLPSLRLESLIVVGTLIAAGLLSATPPPDPELTGQTTPPPQVSTGIEGYTIAATLTPGGPGVNTYDVVVTRDGQPVDDLSVRLRFADPALDWRGEWHVLEAIGDGLYTTVGDDLNAAGDWWALIDIGTDEPVRAAFDLTISEDAAVIQSRDPNAFTLLALGGVVIAIGYALTPLARRFYNWLDISPASVTIALGATAAGIAVVVIGVLAAQQASEQYNVTVNPPPQIVNAVLPDQTSLERGRALFDASCPGWSGTRALDELVDRLPRTRDEELYAYVGDGWRSLPPCGELDDADHWDIVNYVRSLEIANLQLIADAPGAAASETTTSQPSTASDRM